MKRWSLAVPTKEKLSSRFSNSGIANFFAHASLQNKRNFSCATRRPRSPYDSTKISFSGDACPKKFATVYYETHSMGLNNKIITQANSGGTLSLLGCLIVQRAVIEACPRAGLVVCCRVENFSCEWCTSRVLCNTTLHLSLRSHTGEFLKNLASPLAQDTAAGQIKGGRFCPLAGTVGLSSNAAAPALLCSRLLSCSTLKILSKRLKYVVLARPATSSACTEDQQSACNANRLSTSVVGTVWPAACSNSQSRASLQQGQEVFRS